MFKSKDYQLVLNAVENYESCLDDLTEKDKEIIRYTLRVMSDEKWKLVPVDHHFTLKSDQCTFYLTKKGWKDMLDIIPKYGENKHLPEDVKTSIKESPETTGGKDGHLD